MREDMGEGCDRQARTQLHRRRACQAFADAPAIGLHQYCTARAREPRVRLERRDIEGTSIAPPSTCPRRIPSCGAPIRSRHRTADGGAPHPFTSPRGRQAGHDSGGSNAQQRQLGATPRSMASRKRHTRIRHSRHGLGGRAGAYRRECSAVPAGNDAGAQRGRAGLLDGNDDGRERDDDRRRNERRGERRNERRDDWYDHRSPGRRCGLGQQHRDESRSALHRTEHDQRRQRHRHDAIDARHVGRSGRQLGG